jgi:antibiotic biosynthesis monooxygenase (ABM) superfamily enzyme
MKPPIRWRQWLYVTSSIYPISTLTSALLMSVAPAMASHWYGRLAVTAVSVALLIYGVFPWVTPKIQHWLVGQKP